MTNFVFLISRVPLCVLWRWRNRSLPFSTSRFVLLKHHLIKIVFVFVLCVYVCIYSVCVYVCIYSVCVYVCIYSVCVCVCVIRSIIMIYCVFRNS